MRLERPQRRASRLLILATSLALALTPSAAFAQKARGAAASKAPLALPARTDFTEAEQRRAIIPGIPDARFWGDSDADYERALPTQPGAWLALSAGGPEGAFGAGLLNGLSAAGTRPDFALVTGASTGALIATLAFLGSDYDAALKDYYTTVSDPDIYEVRATGESLLDTWPLRKLIERIVDAKLLAKVAERHRAGRRLWVLTTNLDAERPMVWNIGAIAMRGDDAALKLVQDVLLASSSMFIAFPPVYIEVETDGRRLREQHADGALSRAFYIAPETYLAAASEKRLPATDIYVVINGKYMPGFSVGARSIPGILSRTIAVAMRTGTRANAELVYQAAQRAGAGFHLAYVPDDFDAPSRGQFDPDYMTKVFSLGVAQGKAQTPFALAPPRLPSFDANGR